MGVDQCFLANLPLIPFPVLICTKMPVAVEPDRAIFACIDPACPPDARSIPGTKPAGSFGPSSTSSAGVSR